MSENDEDLFEAIHGMGTIVGDKYTTSQPKDYYAENP